METHTLLPTLKGLRIDHLTTEAQAIGVYVTAVGETARCPLCSKVATRIHSHYPRTLLDMPWNRVAVRVHVKARKFFCDNTGCRRAIFTEPLPQLADRYARKTMRLAETLLHLTWMVGGEAGTRIARLLGLTFSSEGLRKRLKKQAGQRHKTALSTKVGLDDFAFRRGNRYGALLIDLETRKPIDLLPDREGATVEKWLKAHPGIEIVSRDRSTTFAEAVREAAPDALQVADRFHLVQNLMEAVEKQVAKEYSSLRQTLFPPRPSQEDEGPARLSRRQERAREESRQRRLEKWQKVQDLFQQGYAKKEIARMLCMDKNTVRDYLRTETFPERRKRGSPPGALDAYRAYLQQRWEKGCHNALELWREIRQQGFAGGATAVRDFVRPWRVVCDPANAEGASVALPIQWPSVRSFAWGLVWENKVRPEHKAIMEKLSTSSPVLAQVRHLAHRFFVLIRHRSEEDLSTWQAGVYASGLAELGSFARGLDRDRRAVEAALCERWSNGVTEGHVNRLKLIKRQGYGRASFELLKARVLPLPQVA